MRTSVQLSLLAVAVLVGAACPGPDEQTTENTDHFALTARGANVIPPAADTLANITATIRGSTMVVKYTVGALPSGSTAVDSIFMYTMAASAANYTVGNTGATTYVAPSVRVCGGSIGTATTGLAAAAPSACAADVDITAQPTTVTGANPGNVTTNTPTSLTTSMRNFGQQLVVFTSGANYKRGKIRGTPYLAP